MTKSFLFYAMSLNTILHYIFNMFIDLKKAMSGMISVQIKIIATTCDFDHGTLTDMISIDI